MSLSEKLKNLTSDLAESAGNITGGVVGEAVGSMAEESMEGMARGFSYIFLTFASIPAMFIDLTVEAIKDNLATIILIIGIAIIFLVIVLYYYNKLGYRGSLERSYIAKIRAQSSILKGILPNLRSIDVGMV